MEIALLIILFVVLPVLSAAAFFPIGVYNDLFNVQKTNAYHFKEGEFCFDFSAKAGASYDKKHITVTAKDGAKLIGEYHDIKGKKTALLVHGYRSNPSRDFPEIAGWLIERGYNVLAIFQRAHGVSGGNHVGCGLIERFDVITWVDWIDKNTSASGILIYGMSMGGAAVGYGATEYDNPKIKAMVIDSTYHSFYEVIIEGATKWKRLITFTVNYLRKKNIKKYGIDIKTGVEEHLAHNKIPTAFIMCEQDPTVPLWQMQSNYNGNASEKILISAPVETHGKALIEGGDQVREKFFDFIDNYMGESLL